MLTGFDPFGFDFKHNRVSNDSWLSAHAHKEPILLRSQPNSQALSSDLEKIVMRCLEKKPNDRFSSVSELSQALRSICAGIPIQMLQDSTASYAAETIVRPQRASLKPTPRS
jgi:eukaryotic-like serine/threonine-protein kinase